MTRECLNRSYKYFLPQPIIPVDHKSCFSDREKAGFDTYGLTGSGGEFVLRAKSNWVNDYTSNKYLDRTLAKLKQAGSIDWIIKIDNGGFILENEKKKITDLYDNLIDCWLAFYKIGCDGDNVALDIEMSRIEACKAFAGRDDVFLTRKDDKVGENYWLQVLFETGGHLFCRTVLTQDRYDTSKDCIIVLRKQDRMYVGSAGFVLKKNTWSVSNMSIGTSDTNDYEDVGQALNALFSGIGNNPFLSGHTKMSLHNKGEEFGEAFKGAKCIDDRAHIYGIAVEPA